MGKHNEFTLKNVELQKYLVLRCLETVEYTILKHRREVWTKDVSVPSLKDYIENRSCGGFFVCVFQLQVFPLASRVP